MSAQLFWAVIPGLVVFLRNLGFPYRVQVGEDFDRGLCIRVGAHIRYIPRERIIELAVHDSYGDLLLIAREMADDIRYTIAQYEF